jgi:hypothetical protein
MDPIKRALTECTGTVFCVWTDCGSMGGKFSRECLIDNIDWQQMLCLLNDEITVLVIFKPTFV